MSFDLMYITLFLATGKDKQDKYAEFFIAAADIEAAISSLRGKMSEILSIAKAGENVTTVQDYEKITWKVWDSEK